MQKTFNFKEVNGHKYNFIDLPGTNLFKFEIVNMMGSNIERVYEKITGKNIYGLSHLVEHLGFRATKDYTTEQLMENIKTLGHYNASTDHNRINYWFSTTSEQIDVAISLVCNYALNDLTKISQEEFDIEKKVVFNEAKQSNDDDQTTFWYNVTPTICGLHAEDNVIGIPNTIDTFSLDDAIIIKRIFLLNGLMYGNQFYNVLYDSTTISEEDIIRKIEKELVRFDVIGNDTISVILDQYNSTNMEVQLQTFHAENESEQILTAVVLNNIDTFNIIAARLGNAYLSTYSNDSLTDIIREQHGLTYHVSFFEDLISNKNYTCFGCDVTPGNEQLLMSLFEQSIETSVANFTPEVYNKLMDSVRLKRTLRFANQQEYSTVNWISIFYPDIINKHAGLFAENINVAIDATERDFGSYENVHNYIQNTLTQVQQKNYSLVTNITNKG